MRHCVWDHRKSMHFFQADIAVFCTLPVVQSSPTLIDPPGIKNSQLSPFQVVLLWKAVHPDKVCWECVSRSRKKHLLRALFLNGIYSCSSLTCQDTSGPQGVFITPAQMHIIVRWCLLTSLGISLISWIVPSFPSSFWSSQSIVFCFSPDVQASPWPDRGVPGSFVEGWHVASWVHSCQRWPPEQSTSSALVWWNRWAGSILLSGCHSFRRLTLLNAICLLMQKFCCGPCQLN